MFIHTYIAKHASSGNPENTTCTCLGSLYLIHQGITRVTWPLTRVIPRVMSRVPRVTQGLPRSFTRVTSLNTRASSSNSGDVLSSLLRHTHTCSNSNRHSKPHPLIANSHLHIFRHMHLQHSEELHLQLYA